ncbi:MAG: Peptidase M23, partial [Candidatus Nomurabacteria bacterium GW2011_GWF2_40_12]
ASQAWPSWSTPGVKHVSVTSNGQTANCTTVTIISDYNPPQVCQDPAANNYHISYPCTYDNPPVNYKYTVTASAGQGGSISPSSRQVNSGSTASFTVSPNSGYSINSVTSTCGGNLSGNTFTTGPVRSNCSVYASFDQHQGQGPIVILNSNSSSVGSGETAVLYWSTINNPTSCVASGGWSGSKSPSGGNQTTTPLYSNTTFTLTCTNAYGSDSASTTVTIENTNDSEGPDATTRNATDVDTEDAVLNGLVDGNGLSTRAWFEYGTSASNLNRSTSSSTYGAGSTNYETHIYNLDEDTTYYFRAVAENSEGTDRGSILSFTTDEEDNNDNNDEGPDVTTRNATNVSSSEATLNGRVDGNGRTTRAWFEYGTSSSLGYSTARTSYGSGSTNYERTITGLMPNTTYYFRAMAENSEGTDRGSILSFYTTGGYIPPVNNQPTVVIYADSTNLAYNGSTTVRWSAVNATSCIASGGSVGWAGIKSMGPGSFYTGSLTSTRTYTISCSNNYGSSTDSVTVRVRGQVINDPVIPTSYVIINSSVDRNQPIVPTIDNTRPHPGDEINYTVTYQNVGNASITGLTLRLDLPYEVDYMFSNPSNPTRSGNTLIFNLGTLRANAQGTVTVRVRVRDNIPAGTYLNFPAILSYVDPSGHMQSVNANVSAQIWSEPIKEEAVQLGANVFGAGFFPTNIFGWLLLIVLILLLVYLAKYTFGQPGPLLAPFSKKTTTTTIQH